MAKRVPGSSTGKAIGRSAKSGQYEVKTPRASVTASFALTGAIGGMTERVPGKGGATNATKSSRMARSIAASVLTHTTLKKAGGSLVMTVPAPARHALHLAEGTEMTVTVEGDRLVLEPVKIAAPVRRLRRPSYTLDDLLAQSDFDAPRSEEEQAWIDAPPVGREIW